MLFNSLQFVVFFLFVLPLAYLTPFRFRWLFLILASCFFYMTLYPVHVLIIFAQISIDYFAALKMAPASGVTRRRWLLLSLIGNFSILGIYKYANFATVTFAGLFGLPPPHFDLILPLGISFYTFQSVSYAIEVYKGRQPPERHLGYYAAYVLFWPQLIAGPIERPQHLLPQLHRPSRFTWENLFLGLKLMLRGYFKKVVIADRLALLVANIYDAPDPGSYNGMALLIATGLFAIQIYCDFSGYSDIAIGAARTMGFDVLQNFNYPYFATSIRDFWQRWHISLSTWFRDYVYIPLGGSRVSAPRHVFNLMVTFLLSGLWHGASWTFIVWGAFHGALVAVESLLSPLVKLSPSSRLSKIARIAYAVFAVSLVNLGWIFFRAGTLTDALRIFSRIVTEVPAEVPALLRHVLRTAISATHLPARELVCAFGLIALLLATEFLGKTKKWSLLSPNKYFVVRAGAYSALLWLLIVFGKFDSMQSFIYFRF